MAFCKWHMPSLPRNSRSGYCERDNAHAGHGTAEACPARCRAFLLVSGENSLFDELGNGKVSCFADNATRPVAWARCGCADADS